MRVLETDCTFSNCNVSRASFFFANQPMNCSHPSRNSPVKVTCADQTYFGQYFRRNDHRPFINTVKVVANRVLVFFVILFLPLKRGQKKIVHPLFNEFSISAAAYFRFVVFDSGTGERITLCLDFRWFIVEFDFQYHFASR